MQPAPRSRCGRRGPVSLAEQFGQFLGNGAAKFLGTIYVPSATLKIDGAGNKIANESAWTVIVAKAVKLQGSPKLVVNSNYGGSTVPVPGGVGPRSGSVTLVK